MLWKAWFILRDHPHIILIVQLLFLQSCLSSAVENFCIAVSELEIFVSISTCACDTSCAAAVLATASALALPAETKFDIYTQQQPLGEGSHLAMQPLCQGVKQVSHHHVSFFLCNVSKYQVLFEVFNKSNATFLPPELPLRAVSTISVTESQGMEKYSWQMAGIICLFSSPANIVFFFPSWSRTPLFDHPQTTED